MHITDKYTCKYTKLRSQKESGAPFTVLNAIGTDERLKILTNEYQNRLSVSRKKWNQLSKI